MMTPRIKICGITSLEDALMCASHGIDALGLVFYPPSPRYISVEAAREIISSLPPFITVVGLFMNAEAQEVENVINNCRIDRLQFHGSETAQYCQQFELPYFKALAMGDGQPDFTQLSDEYAQASAFLLDSHRRDESGGSGSVFDWAIVPADVTKPLILAGGLTPDNVQLGIRTVLPYAVDCSSGVEQKPGVKDPEKVRQFVENVVNVSTTE
ncbi:MAG: phosphoribosylanthranilate isomerase [Gammaproteobacteria bacterium]|nr:phosphoribosylanthranilate isomerase [Gammaproteobacteria bacterium]